MGVGQIRFLSVNFEVINNGKVIYSSSVSVKQTQAGVFPDVEHMHSVIPDRKTRAWVILSLKDYVKSIPDHLI